MPKLLYVPKKFSAESTKIIDQANEIFDEYAKRSFVLTLRQLYYQFVARDLLPNKQESYKRLGSIINDARLAGRIDWSMMEDRTRNLQEQPFWESPSSIIDAVANQFRIDKWKDQKYRVEVWIEKDALLGVFEGVCNELQLPYFSCRGYCSQTEMWVAGQRIRNWHKESYIVRVLHFGDHDPSGLDMTRDIKDRLSLFTGKRDIVQRLALTMEQIEEYSPPPNPAKTTDSRASDYIATYGEESWELDALSPEVLADLVRTAVAALRDEELWQEATQEEEEHRRLLGAVSDRWADLTEGL